MLWKCRSSNRIFTARLDCFLKIHYSFDPPEPCPQQCTFGFALLFFLIAGCRLHRLTDRNVTAGFWQRHHIADRSATCRYLIGFMALRHIYISCSLSWIFFAFMRLSKVSIHPGNNRPDFAISELLSNATRHPTESLRGFESLNGNQTERSLSSCGRSRKSKYY